VERRRPSCWGQCRPGQPATSSSRPTSEHREGRVKVAERRRRFRVWNRLTAAVVDVAAAWAVGRLSAAVATPLTGRSLTHDRRTVPSRWTDDGTCCRTPRRRHPPTEIFEHQNHPDRLCTVTNYDLFKPIHWFKRNGVFMIRKSTLTQTSTLLKFNETGQRSK